jgi:hypothetical protein
MRAIIANVIVWQQPWGNSFPVKVSLATLEVRLL